MKTVPQQLDIFAHSHDVMLRNDVLGALERHDAAGALVAQHALVAAFPKDPQLPWLDALIRALELRSDAPLPDHDALARERHALEHDVATAARQAFGAAAADAWLRTMWQALAARSAKLPFQPARVDDHAAALWLHGQQWAAVVEAAAHIESWRRIPAPLAWVLEARCRLGELDASWALLAELAWLSPGRLNTLLRRLNDPVLTKLHKKFDASFEASGDAADLAWFPAWVLTQTPALAPHLASALPSQQRAAERGMRLVVELLGLERQGRHHELVQQRRALRDLHAPLYAAYMATR